MMDATEALANATVGFLVSRIDVTEALANATVGCLVSWAATWLILGYSPLGSIAVTSMFFALSFSRSWILRRIFRGLA